VLKKNPERNSAKLFQDDDPDAMEFEEKNRYGMGTKSRGSMMNRFQNTLGMIHDNNNDTNPQLNTKATLTNATTF
jgi:hypothetical protein